MVSALRKLRCADVGVGERRVKKLSRGEKKRQIVSARKQVRNLSIRLQLDEGIKSVICSVFNIHPFPYSWGGWGG